MLIAEGNWGRVAATRKVARTLLGLLSSRQKREKQRGAAIARTCKTLAETGRVNNPEKFRKENGFYAIKAHQHRFYAVQRELAGERFWILLDYYRKKQDKFPKKVRDRIEDRIKALDNMNAALLLEELLESVEGGL